MCPADLSRDAAINSSISVELDSAINSETVDNGSLTLRCNGANVTGTVSARNKTLFLNPDFALPSGVVCEAGIGTGIQYLDGANVDSMMWTFETGSETRLEWHFTEPRPFAGVTHTILDTLHVDGKLIIAHRFAARLYITVSDDEGETFRRSDPIDVRTDPAGATVEEFDMEYKNGVLYLTWRVLPEDQFSETFFVHSSSSDLLTYATPVIIPPRAATSQSYAPSIAIDDEGRAYISWREDCRDGQSSSCPSSVIGIYIAIFSQDDLIVHVEQLTDWVFSGPQLSFIAGNLFIIWGRDSIPDDPGLLQFVEVHNYSAGMSKLAQLGNLEGIAEPFRIDKLPGDRALLTWFEKDRAVGEHTHYLVRLDGNTQAVSDLEAIARLSDVSPENRCSRVDGNPEGNMSLMIGSAADLFSVPDRGIHLSDDEGKTFHTAVWLEDMGEIYREKIEGDTTDDLCPSFEVTNSGYIHAAWHRVTYSEREWVHTLMHSRANQVAPCSKPTWLSQTKNR